MIKKAKPAKAKTKIAPKTAPKAAKKTVKKVVAKKKPSANRLNNLIQLPKRSAASKTSLKQHFILRINGKVVSE